MEVERINRQKTGVKAPSGFLIRYTAECRGLSMKWERFYPVMQETGNIG